MTLERKPMPPRKAYMSRSALRSSKPPAEGKVQSAKPRRLTGKYVGKTKAQKLAKKRSDDLCEMRIDDDCVYWGSDFHHRLLQSQGGKWEVVNGLRSCRPCHGTVTNTNGRRPEFERKGWIVASHGDPATTPVLMWHNGRQDWFLLKEDGTAELAPFPKGRPEHPDDLDLPGESRDLGGVA